MIVEFALAEGHMDLKPGPLVVATIDIDYWAQIAEIEQLLAELSVMAITNRVHAVGGDFGRMLWAV